MDINRNNPLRVRDHCVLVLEGARADFPHSMEIFFDYVDSIFKELGLVMSKFCYDGARNYLSFHRSRRKLDSILPMARHVTFCSLPESVEHSFEYAYSEMCLTMDHSSYIGFEAEKVPMRSQLWRNVCAHLIRQYRPNYAYLFQRPFDYGAYWYAACISTTKSYPHEEDGRITQWIDALRDDLYLKNGWLREVFPWNFLTEAHLGAPVGDLTLREWILADKNRGTLTPITDEMTLWDVPDERLAEVGKQLLDAGRVFDYMRDIVEKRLPVKNPLSMEEVAGRIMQSLGIESADEVEIRKGDNTPVANEKVEGMLKKKAKKRKK